MKFLKLVVLLFLLSCVTSRPKTYLSNGEDDDEYKKVLFKGWMKMQVEEGFPDTSRGRESDTSLPFMLEYNSGYKAQFSYDQKPNMKESDEFGPLNIPDEESFFFILSPKTLYALSARRNDIAKTVRSMQCSWITRIIPPRDKKEIQKGGVQDIGNYKEGFCFQIALKTGVLWKLCARTMAEKRQWIDILSRRVKNNSFMPGSGGGGDLKIPEDFNFGASNTDEIKEKDKRGKVDGRWTALQTWTDCTLACGGGKQYYQRICIPPIGGGKPCEGPSLLMRECNTQPCPTTYKVRKYEKAPTGLIVAPISNRPQRYETCIVKEGDMNVKITLPEFEAEEPQIPCRVVLNNRTISIFASATYDAVYKSFDLHFLNLLKDPKDLDSCLVLQDTRDKLKRASLCIMPAAIKPDESISLALKKWYDDILFFKNKCKDKLTLIPVSEHIRKEMEAIEFEKVRDEDIRVKMEDANQKTIAGQKAVEASAELAVDEVKKEIKYERLALKDEIEQEKDYDRRLDEALSEEEDKSDCFEKDLNRKQKLHEIQEKTMETSSKAKDLQTQADFQVKNSRKRALEKLKQMRMIAERRHEAKKKQILELRTTMASKFFDENKIGDKSKCALTTPKDKRDAYCKDNFEMKPTLKEDCLSGEENYCFSCCEFEFGRFHQEIRDDCYKQCVPLETNGTNGVWAYTPRISKD